MAQPDVRVYASVINGVDSHISTPSDYIVLTTYQSSIVFAGPSQVYTDYPEVQSRTPQSDGLLPFVSCWISHANVFTQCEPYATEAGGTSVRRHFAVRFFDNACVRAPLIKAWDNNGEFTTVNNKIFTGSKVNSFQSLIAAVDADAATPDNEWWNDSVLSPGGGNVLLRGDDSFLMAQSSGSGLQWDSANGEWDFHLIVLAPSDIIIGPGDYKFDLQLIYYYT